MSTATAGEIFLVLKATKDNYNNITGTGPELFKGLMRYSAAGVNWEGDGYYPYANGEVWESFGSGTTNPMGDPSVALDQFHVFNVTSTSTEWTARFNNAVQFTTISNTVGFRTNPILGLGSSYFPSYFAGDIAEVIVYNRALSASERDSIYSYLGSKYALGGAPTVPLNLTAQSLGATQVNLSWQYPLTNFNTKFELERKEATGAYSQIALVDQAASYLDTTVTGGRTYQYRVRARNYVGTSSYSNEVTVTTPVSGTGLPMTGMKLWLKADSGTTTPVSTWKNQVGNGEVALQAGSDNKPTLIANGLNGKPVVRFDGTNDFLNLPDVMSTATAGEIFLVLKATQDNYNSQAVVNGSTCKGLMRYSAAGTNWEGDNYYPFKNGRYRTQIGLVVT